MPLGFRDPTMTTWEVFGVCGVVLDQAFVCWGGFFSLGARAKLGWHGTMQLDTAGEFY